MRHLDAKVIFQLTSSTEQILRHLTSLFQREGQSSAKKIKNTAPAGRVARAEMIVFGH